MQTERKKYIIIKLKIRKLVNISSELLEKIIANLEYYITKRLFSNVMLKTHLDKFNYPLTTEF